jgi:Tol biopolymer transport system component/DNA-binding winged helix-turn-helix (wHTH) protein
VRGNVRISESYSPVKKVMASPAPAPDKIRFGRFELDVTSGELRKSGILLKLQPQPFRVLLLLIESAGQVVTREEIQRCLWTDSTFVDFEHGINFSINQVRCALTDSAENPRYVETIPKRGYRFIAPVEVPFGLKRPVVSMPVQLQSVTTSRLRPELEAITSRRRSAMMMIVIFAAAFLGSAYFLSHRAAPAAGIKPRRLTANPSGMPVDRAMISPDGKYLAYSDQSGIQLQLIGANETHTLEALDGFLPSQAGLYPAAWFPNAVRLMFNAELAGKKSIWTASVLGGSPQKLRDDALGYAVSPDGSLIAFTTHPTRIGEREIWLMGSDGEDARKLLTATENSGVGRVVWSPEGQRIAYQRFHWETDKFEISVESCDLKGSQCVVILSDSELVDFWWGPDGRLIYSRTEPQPNEKDSNLWEIRINPRTALRLGEPRRLTNWAGFSFEGLTGTSNGKRLAFRKNSVEFDVYVGELERSGGGLKMPRRLTLDDHDDFPFAWTPDSKAVIFMSNRNGPINVFKQPLDGKSAELIATGPGEALAPTLSPDGSWILYAVTPKFKGSSQSVRLMRVPLSGGAPQEILETHGYLQHDCTRLPATLCVFAEQIDDRQVVFWAFDPILGKGRELLRYRASPSDMFDWALAPDGLHVATIKSHDPEGRIRILSLTGKSERDVVVPGRGGFCSVNWDADGNGFLVTSQSPRLVSLLHVNWDGRAKLLWQRKATGGGLAIPSPDGRYLAVAGSTADSNVWILEDF